MPTAHALAPTLVPSPLISRAVAAWTSASQTAVICGPALGGLIYAISPVLIGVICLFFFACSITLITLVKTCGPAPSRDPPTFASVLAGFHYIRSRRRLLGVITLDLFVVILGGATALLPIFARDILAVGPIGLGLLRSAPAVGALITAVVLAHHPIERHIGRKMFAVVGIFGVATIAFGLSNSFLVSLLALAILGASDAVSIVIRFSLVQIETPDEKRGRVSAINYLFVGSSNTLGEFESGLVAAWLGAIPSVVIGGLGSLLVAGIWMMLFPDLRRSDRFEPADREQART
jgi:predicted MFS family arabinose efflux permease